MLDKSFLEKAWSRDLEELGKDFENVEKEEDLKNGLLSDDSFQIEIRFVKCLKTCKEEEIRQNLIEKEENLEKDLSERELLFQNMSFFEFFNWFKETQEGK